MTFVTRAGAAVTLVAAATLSIVSTSSAQSVRSEIETIVREYLAQHPDEIGDMVKGYLAQHPEALQQAIIDMMKKRDPANGQATSARSGNLDKAAAIKTNADLLFYSKRQVTLGNTEGDVTLVEFFDYNCGYCKRALSDTIALLKDDPELKIVLKEYPALKYLAYHEKLLGERGFASRETALSAAREAKVDMVRLEIDVASDEVSRTIEESRQLGQSLGIKGTPIYVVGNVIVPGAIGVEALKKAIQQARN